MRTWHTATHLQARMLARSDPLSGEHDNVCTHVYTHKRMCTHTHTVTHARTHTHVHTHTHRHARTHTHAQARAHTHTPEDKRVQSSVLDEHRSSDGSDQAIHPLRLLHPHASVLRACWRSASTRLLAQPRSRLTRYLASHKTPTQRENTSSQIQVKDMHVCVPTLEHTRVSACAVARMYARVHAGVQRDVYVYRYI